MALQAYIDESIDENGVIVLAGYIASAESWADFSKEWEEMLPFGLPDKQGIYYFKMSHMAVKEERMSRVPGFFRIIEKHVLGFVSAKVDKSELDRAIARISVPSTLIDWDKYYNPYYLTFRGLLSMFNLNRDQMTDAIPLDEKIDFIFDDRTEKKDIISTWDEFLENTREEVKQYFGAAPRFEDDKEFLPLQAADFWAWWVRKWYVEGTPEKIRECDFGTFKLNKGERKYLKIDITYNEEELVTVLKRLLRKQLGNGITICDSKNP